MSNRPRMSGWMKLRCCFNIILIGIGLLVMVVCLILMFAL